MHIYVIRSSSVGTSAFYSMGAHEAHQRRHPGIQLNIDIFLCVRTLNETYNDTDVKVKIYTGQRR